MGLALWFFDVVGRNDVLVQNFILNMCLHVCSTAVATVRQAVALIFDSVLRAENLPVLHYGGTSGWSSSSNSVAGEVSRSISTSE